MKTLIVYAHPRPESLSHAILKTLSNTLIKNGHDVIIRDLYGLKFNPVLSAEETIHIVDGKFVRDNAVFPDDVQTEMDLIKDSDLLVFIYPVWWNGFPAILKGYIERVYQHGFAYSFENDEPKKTFQGKKAYFIHCTGQPQEGEEAQKLTSHIKAVTSEWLFNSLPVTVIAHDVYGRVPYLNEEECQAILADIENKFNQF